jgi:hypothetical protein
MDKIPFISCLLHAFMGENVTDYERVRIILDIKNVLGNDTLNPVKTTTGIEFLFFLAAFSSIKGKLFSKTNQLTILHLSECLTVINTFKSPNQRKLLLISKDTNKNASTCIISTVDLPSLQVTAILHILNGIIESKVPLDLHILADVLGSALRFFFKIVLHPFCSSNLRKAYLALMITLLDKKNGFNHLYDHSFSNDILGSLLTMLKKCNGEILRDGTLDLI